MTAGRPLLVRVEQAQVDVTLELLDSRRRSVVKVDAPTRRAGPELLLASAQTPTTRTLVVASTGKGTAPISLIEPSAVEARGLALLTSAAAVAAADTSKREADMRQALEEFRAARAARHEAEALSRIAATDYWVKGDWSAAAASALEAMHAWEKIGDDVMWSQSAVIRAASLIETAQETQRARGRSSQASVSQFDDAEQLLTRAAASFRAAGLRYDEAHALNNGGLTNFYRGRNDVARPLYTRAASIFRALGDEASEMLPLQNVAVLDFDRGDYAHAVESYESLLARLPANHDPLDRISLLNNLALAHDVVGNADKALRNYMAALALTNSRFPQDRARTLHGLGNLYLRLGDVDRGGDFLQQALALRRTMNPPERRSLFASLIAVGDWHRERGEYAQALKLHLDAFEQAVSTAQKARTYLVIGRDHFESESIDPALASFERGLALDLPDEFPVRASLKSGYGEAKLRAGDPIGYALISSAAATHRAHGNDELAAQDYLKLARADVQTGRLDQALRNSATSLSLIERHRASATNPDLRATYVAGRAAAYELQADVYMSLAKRERTPAERQRLESTALATALTRRAHGLYDFRALAEPRAIPIDRELRARQHRMAALMDQQDPPAEKIEALRKEIALLNAQLDLAHSGGASASRPASVSGAAIEAFGTAMPENAVVLVYLLGDARSWVWGITRKGSHPFALAGRTEIERAARELQELWSSPVAQGGDREREEAASRVILGDAMQLLAGHRKVEIVADGELARIPFAALRVPAQHATGTARLIETHTVSRLAGLEVAPLQSPSSAANRMLLVGDALAGPRAADTFDLSVGGFRALPGARREIAEIREIAAAWQADTLAGAQATKDALLRSPLASYRILHFATHARADVSNPQLSTLMLSPSKATGEASLTLREIVGLDLRADLVVLSACEGALGKHYRGQLSFGLSEAFLLGGAETVVGGLWRVSDAATQRYMALFYDQYITRAASPAGAAQRAARVMMNDPKYAHPFYWAAFVVLAARTPTRGGAT